MGGAYYVYLAILAAGVGFIVTYIVNSFNDFLLKKHLSVVHPDTMISVDFLKIMNPVQAMKEGIYSIFLSGWFSVFIFMVLWLTPLYHQISGGNIFIGAAIYAFSIYLFMMLIVMPLAGRGVFGVLYHPNTPYWSFFLLIVYAVLLAMIVGMVL